MSTLYPDIVCSLFRLDAVTPAPKPQNLRCNVQIAKKKSSSFLHQCCCSDASFVYVTSAEKVAAVSISPSSSLRRTDVPPSLW
jgi:hypothetical protein